MTRGSDPAVAAALRIVTLPNGQFAENCYLVAPADGREAVIVDPGEEPARFLRTAERAGLVIREIWLTHAHLDHILGVGVVQAATGAPISLHGDDESLYRNLPEQAARFGLEAVAPPPIDRTLAYGDRLRLGDLTFEVRHTPGHSPGSVCFVAPGHVLSGDVLFQSSIGRTDLPGGSFERLTRSIDEELLTLPDATAVYPGHGPATTIGRERRENPFLRGR